MTKLSKLVHADGIASEYMALGKISPTIGSMREQILADIKASPSGITPDEWAEKTHSLINTVRRRFTDLWKDGFIKHHPQKLMRQNNAGNPCVVWVQDDAHARGGNKSRIQDLTDRVHELELLLNEYQNRFGALT